MAGNIGLTGAGQYLDRILTETNPSYKASLNIFITDFTKRLKRLRRMLDQNDNMSDKQLILTLLRNEYMMRLDKGFKENITDKFIYSLIQNYIHTLTKINFIPTTKTQIVLNSE
jgi:hypothetical protein